MRVHFKNECPYLFEFQVLRHGDRAPIPQYELYPNDPYKNYNFTPPGHGQLTRVSFSISTY